MRGRLTASRGGLARISELRREADGGGLVILENGVRLRVARSRRDDLERALGP